MLGRTYYLQFTEIKGASMIHVNAWRAAGGRPGEAPGAIQVEESRDKKTWKSAGNPLALDGSQVQALVRPDPWSSWIRLKATIPGDPGSEGTAWSMDVTMEPGDG